MLVETFELQEVEEQTVEQTDECAELIAKLELEGQQQFYRKAEQGGTQVFPYRKMTAQEKLVLSTVLPSETEIAKYKDGPIPLRVLQVAAHAKQLLEDDGKEVAILVWHPANADYKDPYLVLRHGVKYSAHEHYLLARWGESLDNFTLFIEKAKAILTARRKESLMGIKAEVEAALGALDETVELMVLTGKDRSPSFYNH